ncbi:MAG: LysR family transcriptional regulator, partial [Methyloversatilis sp.]|nr:LysR family transcriptional regulator [Methyloversatilis sp.]
MTSMADLLCGMEPPPYARTRFLKMDVCSSFTSLITKFEASMLNYRHLYYFWVATKEGGIARAAERLDMAVQTVSTQIRELERALGHALFKPSGR